MLLCPPECTGFTAKFTGCGNQEKNTEAEKLFGEILPVLAFSNQHLDISVHFFKRLLFKQGIYPTDLVREPILPFDGIHREIAIN
jgi:hypothetical protein